MSSLQFLAGIASNDASNDSFNTDLLTQPEMAADADVADAPTAASNNVVGGPDPVASADPPSKPAGGKRKSKLKRARGSSKSALEIMTSETTAAAAAGRGKSAPAPSRSKTNDSSGAPAAKKATTVTVEQEQLLSQISVGTRLEVYWPDDKKHYAGVVTVCPMGVGKKREYTIRYEDGDVETVNLAVERFRILDDAIETVKESPLAASNPTIAAVTEMRSKLEALRQSDDRNAAKKILAVLRKLDQRTDIDFEALFHTGIGKTVNKLAKSKYGKVREAANPILQNWKMIDQSTPSPVKRAVRMAASNDESVADKDGREPGKSTATRATSKSKSKKSDNKPLSAASPAALVTPAARNNDGMVDLTDTPPPAFHSNSSKQASHSKKQSTALPASAAKITPATACENSTDGKEMPRSPPELKSSSSYKENEVVVVSNGNEKSKDPSADTDKKPSLESRSNATNAKPKEAKQSTVPVKPNELPGSANPAAKPSTAKVESVKRPAPATTDVAVATQQPPKKKKTRSFHDQILYIMLTSCKPYSLKSLAKATGTTVEGLRHAMLSFVDKKLVICKEFPSKKGSDREPKKLYWANPTSLADAAGAGKGKKSGGAMLKELSKLLSTPEEVEMARKERQQLEQQLRELQCELTPLLAVPTMKELDDQVLAEEQELKNVQDEIQAVKDRMANASKPPAVPAAPHYPNNRFKRPPAKPQSPTTLKRKINHMLGEYKTRKRKCMDFVEQLSDAMEKKTQDVMGDKVLQLETDEMEWGQYEDGATGKVYGTAPKRAASRGLLGRKNSVSEEEPKIVKIPAKYRDV